MMSGKWHVTPTTASKHNWPLQRGFDRYYGIISGSASYYQPLTLTRDNDPIEPEGADFYLTDAIGRTPRAYIEAAAQQPDPFFLYVGVHLAALAAARLRKRYRALPRPLPRWLGCPARRAPPAA